MNIVTFLGYPLTVFSLFSSASVQGSSAFVLPVSQHFLPGGEFNMCIVSARSSGALWVTEVNKQLPLIDHFLLTSSHLVTTEQVFNCLCASCLQWCGCQTCSPGPRPDQWQSVCPVCRLSGCLHLQDCQDVLCQRLPWIQGTENTMLA